MSHFIRLVFVALLLAIGAGSVRADMPAGPWPWSKSGSASRDRYHHLKGPLGRRASPRGERLTRRQPAGS